MKKLFTLFVVVGLFLAVQNSYTQNMAAGGQLGIAFPMSGMSEDHYTTGFGLRGSFHYELQPKLWLTGWLGYERFGYDNPTFKEGHFATIPILAGVKYELGEGDFVPYGGAEIGFHLWSWSKTKLLYVGEEERTDSGSSLALSPLVGMMKPLNPNMILDASIKYNVIIKDVVNYPYLSIHLGVIVPIQ